jgi:signal transduction histidine kinase
MKTFPSGIGKLKNWLRKSTQGTRIMQWISYVMIFSVLVVFILEYPVGESEWRYYGTVLILAVLLVLNILMDQTYDLRLSARQNNLFLWAFNIVTDSLALVAVALTGRGEIVFLMFMQVSQFAYVFGVWPLGALNSLINLAVILAIMKGFGLSTDQLISVLSQLSVGFVFVQVVVLQARRSAQETERAERLLKELQAAHGELKAAQEKEKELAVAEERVRLARDIHDGLGHHLTVLSIQLQAAEKLVDRNPQAAAESIRLSRTEAQAALEEVRRSVSVMRESPGENRRLEDVLSTLARDFEERTQLEINFEQRGNPLDLSSFAWQTLFRAVQEGLTNVQKHGREAKHIRVKLEYEPEAVRLIIRDDGRAAKAAAPEATGYGLTGLRERVEQLGGTLCSGPEPEGGFTLELRIPLREDVHD